MVSNKLVILNIKLMNTCTKNGLILNLRVKPFFSKVELPAVVFYDDEAKLSSLVTFGQRHKYLHMVITSAKFYNIINVVTVKHQNINSLGKGECKH